MPDPITSTVIVKASGDIAAAPGVGMQYFAEITDPTGFSGTGKSNWAQLLNTKIIFQDWFSSWYQNHRWGVADGLDGTYPYLMLPWLDCDGTVRKVADSPGFHELFQDMLYDTIFKTFLQYRAPGNSMDIPLKTISWRAKGHAAYNNGWFYIDRPQFKILPIGTTFIQWNWDWFLDGDPTHDPEGEWYEQIWP